MNEHELGRESGISRTSGERGGWFWLDDPSGHVFKAKQWMCLSSAALV
ncbi:MAG: hypothetical protein H6718_01065 [Polyangiaceae bacterium]|nr:hypothetical protein [Myxococcales bacterium]MCB9583952.1 hypothetical protein [Polyangiaceae bacterium]MCB9607792.1 hypothetical protein [Polyangiaceae bacterium]